MNVLCVSVEYNNIMRKLKSRWVNSVSAIALALLAFSLAFTTSQAYAEGLEVVSPPPQTVVADASTETAEGLGVLCHSYSDGAETCVSVVLTLESTVADDLPTSA